MIKYLIDSIAHALRIDDAQVVLDIGSSSRKFDGARREFVMTRDQSCRAPYCEAPTGAIDHVVRHTDGGRTRAMNAQDLCKRCNYANEAPGWQHRAAAPIQDYPR